VTSQLAISNKKPRFGPKVTSRDWWIERIKIKKPEIRYWTHFTKCQIAQFKVLAELDYQVLGEKVKTEGAPDADLIGRNYPPKLKEQPYWCTLDWTDFKNYRLWTWFQVTKALDLPITEKAETWYNYFSIKGNQIRAKELLDPFRKENVSITLISAHQGSLQGVSRRSPGRSRPREHGRSGSDTSPYVRTRQPEG
jgi:hypothetical protein